MESHHVLFDYHRSLLADRVRLERFDEALRQRITPGDGVVDIGAGTGILSMLACRAGARRVYAIEQGDVAELARSAIQHNGLSDRIILLRGNSTHLSLPEPADVLVGEILGNMGLNEGILQLFMDARRFLRPGGSLVPEGVQVIAVPVEAADRYEQLVEIWNDGPGGFKFAPVAILAAQQTYHGDFETDAFVGKPQAVIEADLRSTSAPFASGNGRYPVVRTATMHGIAIWFRAALTEKVSLTNAPPNTVKSWHQTFLPLETPLVVRSGDAINVRLSTYDGSS